MKIKKGDQVLVIKGKDRNKKEKFYGASPRRVKF